MIGKVRKGDNFMGLARYLTRNGRGHVLGFDNLASDSPDAAAYEMTIAAATSRRTTRPVLHLSLSYGADEPVTPDQMRSDARRVMKALGMGDHQAVTIAHGDTEHQHVHVMANRVGPGGKTASDSHSYARIEAALRKIEVERGWAPVAGRNAPVPTTGRRMTGHQTSRDPRQHQVPDRVRRALLHAETWADLHQGVRGAGWRLEIIQKGRGSGALLVGPSGERVAAGRIDRGASLTNLRRRLGRDPESRERALATLAKNRPKPRRRPHSMSGDTILAAALRVMLASGPGSALLPRRSRRRIPGLPRL